MAKIRLQKVLSAAGVDSRRKCEELILEGLVRVNKKVVDKLPVFVDPDVDVITVDGRRIKEQEKVYFLLNKPKRVICTSSDPHGRKKAVDMIDCNERIVCVGRLDAETTGLIILTNDNELVNRLTHPRYKISKTYVVEIRGKINPEKVEKVKKGVWLSEKKTARSSVKVLRRGIDISVLEIVIKQGLNRQIRRTLAKVDIKVKSLKRSKIGNISVKGLGVGSYRRLTVSEVNYLKKITADKEPAETK